jgi:hypothetical protein
LNRDINEAEEKNREARKNARELRENEEVRSGEEHIPSSVVEERKRGEVEREDREQE